jgi:hypothetical protein
MYLTVLEFGLSKPTLSTLHHFALHIKPTTSSNEIKLSLLLLLDIRAIASLPME